MTLSSLLPGKLHTPKPPGPLVPRPKLLSQLDRSLNATLTVITAPAGSGKTRLVTEWLRDRKQPAGWVSLDKADADLARFLAYFTAAARTVYPESAAASLTMLNSPVPLPAATLAETLLQDLEALPGPLILVLDDYHAAESEETQKLMQRLLHVPPQHLHLIITTRADPALPLARLRSQFQLVEIRNADLRFSQSDTARFLHALAGQPVDQRVVGLLQNSTEGWVVGLQLAGILLHTAPSHEEFAVRFAAHSHRWVAEYLVDEVLAQLSEEMYSVLLQTALLDRFCASLVEAALGPAIASGQGSRIIEQLVNANLFIMPLDYEGIWHRYHHLFRELLHQRLSRTHSAAQIRQIHHRASVWFAENGLTDEAIEHARAAGEEERAVRLIEANLSRALNEEDARQLDRWLDPLPEETRQRPAIQIAEAYRQQWRYRLDAVAPLLDQAEAGLAAAVADYTPEERTAWNGAIASLRSLMARMEGDGDRSLALGELALQLAPPEWRFVRGLAELSQATALQINGRPDEAIVYCRRRLAESDGKPDVRTLRLLLALCNCYLANANAEEIVPAAATYLKVARQSGRSISIGWAHFAGGWGHYQRNELDAAEESFRALIEIRPGIHRWTLVDGYTGLAYTLAAKGRFGDAQHCVREFREVLTELNAFPMLAVADSLDVRLRLMQEERVEIPPPGDVVGQFRNELWELPVLTSMRASIASGRAKQLQRAGELLEVCRGYTQHKHFVPHRIEVEVVAALHQIALGNAEAALASLERAVALARPGGMLRIIADEGPGLVSYLEMLVTRNIERTHVQRILEAYGPWQTAMSPAPGRADARQTSSSNGHGLTSELTFRETEVLALIAQHLTNEEIAERLVIALPTVKRHNSSIFKKLSVENRRQAAARALALGLVAPPDAPTA